MNRTIISIEVQDYGDKEATIKSEENVITRCCLRRILLIKMTISMRFGYIYS